MPERVLCAKVRVDARTCCIRGGARRGTGGQDVEVPCDCPRERDRERQIERESASACERASNREGRERESKRVREQASERASERKRKICPVPTGRRSGIEHVLFIDHVLEVECERGDSDWYSC